MNKEFPLPDDRLNRKVKLEQVVVPIKRDILCVETPFTPVEHLDAKTAPERSGERDQEQTSVLPMRPQLAATPAADVVTEDSAALTFRNRYEGKLLFDHDLNAWF